jgi:hypothetical protein
MKPNLRALLLVFALVAVAAFEASASQKQASKVIPAEIFQVPELPVVVAGVELVKTGPEFELRCSITNTSDEKLLGFRLAVVVMYSDDGKYAITNRNEALPLSPYETKPAKIRMTLSSKVKAEHRVVIMFEQVVGYDSIWDVIKPKDALEAYLSGDYSVIPRVLRVANQVDAPAVGPPQRLRIPF